MIFAAYAIIIREKLANLFVLGFLISFVAPTKMSSLEYINRRMWLIRVENKNSK